MKRFRAKFNPDRKGVYAVSLVDEPAMDGDFVQFKNEQENIKFVQVDSEKRRVMGLILQPNKEVLRFNKEDDYHYTVMFESQDVEDVAYNFQKQGNQNNSTIQHNGKAIEGVSFVETWIVENSKVDKSTNFGFEYPKGSWMGVMQLDNQDVWDNYVKTGKVKGFSIDAFMQFEEINLNKVNMNENEKGNDLLSAINNGFTQLKELLKPKEKEEVKEVALEKEEVVKEVVLMEDKKEDEEEEKVKLEDDPTKTVDDVLAEMLVKIQEMLAPSAEASVEMSKKINDLESKILDFSKEPATKSIKQAPTQLEFSKMTEFQKYKLSKENE